MAQMITILGSTGSIGMSTLDVVSRHEDRFEVFALTARNNVAVMVDQCRNFRPKYAVLTEKQAADQLREKLADADIATEVLHGEESLSEVASMSEVDCVVAAIVGAAGLLPTLAAVRSSKRVLLANKESLVMSGQLFMDAVAESGAILLPVDSEHNAVFQCMPSSSSGTHPVQARKILLTASGGPFRTWDLEELPDVTPEQAVAHPKWSMGPKISVDSATMMNKGLEVIEAVWMFGVDVEDVEIVIHPQSIIHSMVTYDDGSVLAQMGNPDMRTPIAHALAWPDRIVSGVEPLDIFEVGRLEFERPDHDRFPCIDLCYGAIRAGGSASVVLNAANEVAVQSFLDGEIGYTAIAEIIEETMQRADTSENMSDIESIIDCDERSRQLCRRLIMTEAG